MCSELFYDLFLYWITFNFFLTEVQKINKRDWWHQINRKVVLEAKQVITFWLGIHNIKILADAMVTLIL